MKFIFKAKNEIGEIKEGSVEAIAQEAAVQMLQSKGLIPISVEQERENNDILKELSKLWEGVNQKEMSVFYRQLATLIEAKVPIVTALQAVGDQTDNRFLEMVVAEIVEDVKDGMPLSESMSKHPSAFTSLAVSMIKAGEVSGNLQRSIMFLADNTEKNYELNAKIKSALTYPGFILASAVVIGFFVFTVVLPKLTAIFDDMDAKIPWYTQALMDASAFVSTWWWAILMAIIAFVVGTVYYIKTEDGRREWDHVKLRLPVFGNFFRAIYISRFAENLSMLLTGGIPIVRALMIVSDVVNNQVYQRIILKAADEVKTGGSMSSVFAKAPEIPMIVSRMVRIGEDAGKISEVLNNVSQFYEKEIDRTTRNMTSLIEPILIIGMGIAVAVLVFAVLVPIYSITTNMKM